MIIDESRRKRRDVSAKECPDYFERCCKKVNFVGAVDEIVPVIHDERLSSAPANCGLRNSKGLSGMVNNIQNASQYGEFPWMTAILVERTDGNEFVYRAGGSLIHPKVVLTTAHSIAGVDPKKIIARAGATNTQSDTEIYKHVDQKVQKVIRHENFTRNNLQNDIVSPFLINDDIYSTVLFKGFVDSGK
jgi:secreted trypsin-like serine protease